MEESVYNTIIPCARLWWSLFTFRSWSSGIGRVTNLLCSVYVIKNILLIRTHHMKFFFLTWYLKAYKCVSSIKERTNTNNSNHTDNNKRLQNTHLQLLVMSHSANQWVVTVWHYQILHYTLQFVVGYCCQLLVRCCCWSSGPVYFGADLKTNM